MTTLVSIDLLKAQLNLVGTDDDVLLAHKLGAAEAWLAGYIGKPLSTFDPLPADLVEAVLQLAAYHYEQREAASFGVSTLPVPFGVTDLARPHREWSFTDAF
ncbi:head-tail connector protein [Pararhizobium mangrovi]|uniref:Phage gp6-like head-tail connector protein n=1 Tax=Pararhizobium mangrovi TaxID=2590452 RepID=A0A506TYV3_9HYPH|nr:head-tail connector protein [Pararhizobium mangrovi]TPW26388.1 phage gp6-like head-tail connector protein [Pararhizobium mangrovi]